MPPDLSHSGSLGKSPGAAVPYGGNLVPAHSVLPGRAARKAAIPTLPASDAGDQRRRRRVPPAEPRPLARLEPLKRRGRISLSTSQTWSAQERFCGLPPRSSPWNVLFSV